MKYNIDLDPSYLDLIIEILKEYLPDHSKVWMFGSRVVGKAKKYSDIDLAIDIGKPLSIEIISKLADGFDQSSLPYKVDIVDWSSIDATFRENIMGGSVLILDRY